MLTTAAPTENQGFLDSLFNNLYILLAFMFGVLILSAIFNRKKQGYYNFKQNNKTMQNHLLNTKYRLNERKRINLDHINTIISYYYIGTAVISCLTGAVLFYFGKSYNFCLTVTAVLFLALTVISYVVSSNHIGKIYGNNKLK